MSEETPIRRRWSARLTLIRFFGLVLGAGGLLLALLLTLFYRGSSRTALDASEGLMSEASRHLTRLIDGHLAAAEETVGSFTRQWRASLIAADVPDAIERALLRELLANLELTEVTFTGPHLQISAFRSSAAPNAEVVRRRVAPEGTRWQAWRRSLGPDGLQPSNPTLREPGTAADPTAHATYTTPVEAPGSQLWSDVAFAELDHDRPEDERRRVVTLQSSLFCAPGGEPCRPSTNEGGRGALFGVLRVGLLSDRIDALARMRLDERDLTDPAHIAHPASVIVCDRAGRLITRLRSDDRFATVDEHGQPDPEGDLRVITKRPLPPGVHEALQLPALRTLGLGQSTLARITEDGISYLVTFAALPEGHTQEWVVGVVVPEARYLEPLAAQVRQLALLGVALLALAALAGAAALRPVRRDLGRLVAEANRMRGFDFAATAPSGSSFRDVGAAIDSLEQAKTALRALTKYVPLDLVRQLYHARVEPTLGGRLQEATILFSDIAGFTTVSETLPPERLAHALGDYLAALTGAVHATGGIIDKYTGDGVMALWNAPSPLADHALRACEAAVGCFKAAEALFRSEAWQGLPAWRTRFGIHRAEVTIGHFGAPDRMSYTALGDGVNLAARLEGLCKQYGVQILVSAAVRSQADGGLRFRRVDRVAVKGKRDAVEIFELLDDATTDAVAARYQEALDAYFHRRFEDALTLLTSVDMVDDPPSAVLAARCRKFLATPPPHEWDGVYVASEK